MRKFPRELTKHRRPKPQKTADPITPILGPQFEQANKEPVPHLHRDDPGGPANPGLQALYEIFKYIMGQAADLIFDINKGIEDFRDTGNQAKYKAAVAKFDAFLDKLNDETPNPTGEFGPTINKADVEPIKNDEGFYTSARVVVQWLGGTHSDSSMIHVP